MGYSEKQKGKKPLTSTTNQAEVVLVSRFPDLVKFGKTSFVKKHNISNVRKKTPRNQNALITYFSN